MIKGYQKISLVDYPGKIATTVFTGGCNFRCPWCHNREIAFPELSSSLPDIPLSEIKNIIEERREFIDGVCITGGEPTLWKNKLLQFMEWIHQLDLLVKLDTNGYLPDVLQEFYKAGAVDFTAMDIKNCFSRYAETVGLPETDETVLKQSIELIRSNSPEYRFRTTMVPDLVEEKDIKSMEKLLRITITRQKYQSTNVSEIS